MTAPSREDAVRAVAEAIRNALREWYEGDTCDVAAEAALDALTPYIAAVVAADREALAEAVDDLPYHDTLEGRFVVDWQEGFDAAQADAARVIRSAPPWGTTVVPGATEEADRG